LGQTAQLLGCAVKAVLVARLFYTVLLATVSAAKAVAPPSYKGCALLATVSAANSLQGLQVQPPSAARLKLKLVRLQGCAKASHT
jgi:hypothetical protein